MAEVKPQFTEIKLTVPWGHIAARTYGSSTGKPVLMAHGRLDNAGSFTRLMKYLPMDLFYYVCIDLPGHGWSSHFPSYQIIDMMDYAHTLHFIFEALQWKTCIYIGHSLGGQSALLFSVFQPHRIEKLILLDGILINPFDAKDYFTSYLGTASELSIKATRNDKQALYTKEEVLYALKNMRIGSLNSEAAEELFERTVTEVNGKYMYNRDVRLKNSPFTFMDSNECQKFNSRLSIPIYCIIPSSGAFNRYKEFSLILETMKSTMCEIINIDGNHGVHNNNPEKVAPFICKILNSNNSSKL